MNKKVLPMTDPYDIKGIGKDGFNRQIVRIIFSYLLEKILKKKGKSLYSFSFAEGQNINTLELVTYKKNPYFSNINFLINEISDNDSKIYIYKFASPNKMDIDNIKDKINEMNQSDIKNVQTSYNSY